MKNAARTNDGIAIAARLSEDEPRTPLGALSVVAVSVVIIVFSSVAAHVEHNWTFAIIVPPVLTRGNPAIAHSDVTPY
jgi:hypothetical protein